MQNEIRRVATIVGKTPTMADMKENGQIHPQTIIHRFDKWTAALEAAGFEFDSNSKGPDRIDDEDELLAELHRVADEVGSRPRKVDMRDHGKYSKHPYCRVFGSWSQAIEAAGFEPYKPGNDPEYNEADCIAEIHRLKDELDHVPSYRELQHHGHISPIVFRRVFGCWTDSLRTAGYEEHVENIQRGENHPLWEGGKREDYYGPNWPEQRRRARERDGHACRECGIHRDDLGRELDVHHVIPFQRFTDGDRAAWQMANRLENLLTLCPSCHTSADNALRLGS